jgi:hypothetical protein
MMDSCTRGILVARDRMEAAWVVVGTKGSSGGDYETGEQGGEQHQY